MDKDAATLAKELLAKISAPTQAVAPAAASAATMAADFLKNAPKSENVVMQVEGGGRIVQMPLSGSEGTDITTGKSIPQYTFVSPDYSTNNQTIVRGIMNGMSVKDAIAQGAGQPAEPLRTAMSAEPFATAQQAAGGLVGGEGVVKTPESVPLGAFDYQVPIPAPVRAVSDYLGNALMAGAGAGTGAWNYAGGAIADIMTSAGLMAPETAQRFARDFAALPEAFAGSPGQVALPSRIAPKAGLVAERPPLALAAPERPVLALPAPETTMRPAAAETPPTARPAAPTAAPEAPPKAGPEPTAGPAAMTADEMAAEDFNKLMRKAALGGVGSQAAKEKLAMMAKVNPQAQAAADRLGIDMPPDVWADHQQLRAAVGLARSQIGSKAQQDWTISLGNAVDKADTAIEAIDGSPDLSAISADILNNLQKTRNDLKKEASGLYGRVDAKIPNSTLVDPLNSVKLLNQRINDLGGAGALKGKEKELFDLVTNPDVPLTYAGLVTLKQDVGRALEGRGGPYTDVNDAVLKRVYGALAEDQLAAAATIGGDELRQTLRLANQTTAKQKALEKRITGAFGKDLEGSIATAIRGSITSGRRGDIAGLNRVLKTIPQDLQREAMATAISALSRSRRALAGSAAAQAGDDIRAPFSFAEYEKLYRDLRQNSVVYAKVAETLGEDGQKVLRDLYEVSKKVNESSAKITSTGASNQALLGELNAQGWIASAMNSTVGRRATQAAAGAAGAAMGSPLVGAGVGAMVGVLTDVGKKNNAIAMGDMFASDAFKNVVAQAAVGPVSKRAQSQLLADPKFRKWANVVGIPDPNAWVQGVILATTVDQTIQQDQTAGKPQ
jgi:hypothetical protein